MFVLNEIFAIHMNHFLKIVFVQFHIGSIHDNTILVPSFSEKWQLNIQVRLNYIQNNTQAIKNIQVF